MTLFKQKNLWMSESFKDLLKQAKGTGTPIEVTPHILTQCMTDAEVSKEYSSELLDLETALATVDSIISKQSNGEEGLALVNGYGNFMHVEHSGEQFSVFFYWRGGRWDVIAYDFAHEWYARRCFFSRKELNNSDTGNLDTSDALTLERAIGIVKMNGYKVVKEI